MCSVYSRWVIAIYPTLIARLYFDLIAYLYTRKRTDKVEAHIRRRKRGGMGMSGRDGGHNNSDYDAGALDFHVDDLSHDDGESVKFSRNSGDCQQRNLEPLTFASRTSCGDIEGGVDGEPEVITQPKRSRMGDNRISRGGSSSARRIGDQSALQDQLNYRSVSFSSNSSKETRIEKPEEEIDNGGWEREINLERLVERSRGSLRLTDASFVGSRRWTGTDLHSVRRPSYAPNSEQVKI